MLLLTVPQQFWNVPAGNRTWAFVVVGKHSIKELFEQLVKTISCSEHLHELVTWLSQCMCYMNIEHTWTHMNCRIALVSISTLKIDIRHLQVHIFSVRQDKSRWGHRYGETWPRSSPPSTRGPETDMSSPGIKPGPPLWEASTQARTIRTAC